MCCRCFLVFIVFLSQAVCAMDVFFENRPIQEVLPWLATQMNESLILSPKIQSTLTLSIKNTSWREVMEAIAQQPDIDLKWQGKVAVLMPTNNKLDTPSCERKYWVLKHAKADAVGKHLHTLYPKLSLIVDDRTNSIISKTCQSITGLEETLSWLDTPLRQIEIQAQVAQVSTSFQSQLGVDWKGQLSHGIHSSLGGAVDLGALAPDSGFSLSGLGSSGFLSFTLDVLESEGEANVVSKPRIVTSEGKTARIESGTEVPYQTVTEDSTSVEFRQAALMLEVTPFVKEGGQILLQLAIHQDSVGDMVNGVPSLETNRLTTEVVVKDQETLVLGGIFREEKFSTHSKVPLLGDLPLLGALFKRRSEQQEKVELLVFITPKLLQMSVN